MCIRDSRHAIGKCSGLSVFEPDGHDKPYVFLRRARVSIVLFSARGTVGNMLISNSNILRFNVLVLSKMSQTPSILAHSIRRAWLSLYTRRAHDVAWPKWAQSYTLLVTTMCYFRPSCIVIGLRAGTHDENTRREVYTPECTVLEGCITVKRKYLPDTCECLWEEQLVVPSNRYASGTNTQPSHVESS